MLTGRVRLVVWLGLLSLSAAVIVIVSLARTPQQSMSLSVAVDGVTEGMRAIDRVGMLATQVSVAEEVKLGAAIAGELEASESRGSHVDEDYARGVVARLVDRGGLTRSEIRYATVVLDTPVVNAYALPGGHIYITTGMLDLLESETEVAAILGHEMAHVDRKHCIERIQYELVARKIGGTPFETMVQIGAFFARQGFSSELEAEADRQGTLLATRAGYHPQGAQLVFARLRERYHESRAGRATTIPGEVGDMVKGAFDDYFGSHPSDEERIQSFERVFREHQIDLTTTPYYVGRRNFAERTALVRVEYESEWTRGRLYPPR